MSINKAIAAFLALSPVAVVAQSELPRFDVTAVKRCPDAEPGVRGGIGNSSPGRLSLACQSVRGLIQAAYILFAGEGFNPALSLPPIEGGPKWIATERYAINATAENRPSVQLMQGPMLQAVLEDRFQLKLHQETREIPAYELTVAKSGLKLKLVEEGSCTPRVFVAKAPVINAKPVCNSGRVGKQGSNIKMDLHSTNMKELAQRLGIGLDRPVVDKTGYSGRFDFNLEFAIDDSTRGFLPPDGGALLNALGVPGYGPSDDLPGQSVFTVFQNLGLKLEPAKGPYGEFFVIDHIEHPSEN